jgi:Tol biopolymer transport system component
MKPFCQTTAALLLLGLIAGGPAGQPKKPALISHVTVMSVDGKTKKVLYSTPKRFEAPNWSPDSKYLLLNSEGKLWRLPLTGGEPELVATGDVKGINNDHGISPDGKHFAISAGHIYLLPSAGGKPRQVTTKKPSYYHGWSPDGKTLVYCAQREGNFDIYSISVEGGEEKRLTSHAGYDDGPDYSPDGKWIYFNSDRSGSWDIWRMPSSGAGDKDAKAERVTSDEYEDWFPHPSPDGKWLLFLSYKKGTKGHPANQDVVLRMMPLPGTKLERGKIQEVVRLFGGQGTINVSSWSPDSKQFAYVSYELK